jgi:predicted nucleic acid-binding protein
MILLDTSALIASLTGNRAAMKTLRAAVAQGQPIRLSTLVLYEWLRGPRTSSEILEQEQLLPTHEALAFGSREAVFAADLYRAVSRARTREVDIGIAAIAIRHKAHLWTLNSADFADIPGLSLWKGR